MSCPTPCNFTRNCGRSRGGEESSPAGKNVKEEPAAGPQLTVTVLTGLLSALELMVSVPLMVWPVAVGLQVMVTNAVWFDFTVLLCDPSDAWISVVLSSVQPRVGLERNVLTTRSC